MRPLTLLCCVLLLPGCSSQQKWQGGGSLANPELIAREISPDLAGDDQIADAPYIEAPQHLRPCCAFGSGLGVSLGTMPLPGVEIANTIGLGELGLHTYDNGTVAFSSSRPGAGLINFESNGLVYTCRGGFIDTAHLRDWADWTLFLYTRVARMLETGGIIDLPPEAGVRRIVIQPVAKKTIAAYGRKQLAVPIAQWLAFQLSVWHEIATWYGWAALEMFSEKASSFSPEDLYSNLLGIKLAGILIYDSGVGSEVAYNEAMNNAIPNLLMRLGAVDAEIAKSAARSVDGIWWDSKVTLPNANLVIRRNMDIRTTIVPWLATLATPERDPDAQLVAACGRKPKPVGLRNPNTFNGVPFRKRATVEIEVQADLAERMHLASPRLTQEDFPKLIQRIAVEAKASFGPNFDKP